jgi:hypothetical protein
MVKITWKFLQKTGVIINRILIFFPVLILVLLVAGSQILENMKKYILYGGEFIIYVGRGEQKLINDIYEMLKKDYDNGGKQTQQRTASNLN